MATTWRKELADAQESDGPIIACTLTDSELDKEFDDGFGCVEGASFTAWSEARVYFPVRYDGAEWAASVPRHPCEQATSHVGGG